MVHESGKLADYDIRLLRVFVTVVECGGLARAQGELNLSLSSVSGYLSQLEARMGMQLCHRGRRGFSLTDKGKVVYDACMHLFRAHEDFRSIVGGMQGQLIGEIKLGVVDNIVFDPGVDISSIVAGFQTLHERVWITIFTLPPNSLEVALMDGTVHLGIGEFFRTLPAIQYERLASDQQSLYCGSKHALFDRAPDNVTIDDLETAKFADRGYAEASRFPKGDLNVTPSASGFSVEAILIFILSGLFIGYLPKHYATPWVEKGDLRALLPEELTVDTEITLALPKGQKPTNLVRTFVEHVKGHRTP